MQELGVILTPYGAHSPHGWYAEIAQARDGKGTYLPQPGPYPIIDRFFSTRGEVGLYYDTQLGRQNGRLGWLRRLFGRKQLGDMIPTDAEMAKSYVCYTPVHSGWINTPQGYLPNPWRFGWNPAGKYGPSTSLFGLGQESGNVIQALTEHQRKMFWLQALTAAAVSISAGIAAYRQLRLMRREFRARKR